MSNSFETASNDRFLFQSLPQTSERGTHLKCVDYFYFINEVALVPGRTGDLACLVGTTAAGILGTGLSLLTLGTVERFNKTATLTQSARTTAPILFDMAFREYHNSQLGIHLKCADYLGHVINEVALLPKRAGDLAYLIGTTASGILGTGLSLLTLGTVERFNETATLTRSARIIAPFIFKTAIHIINKDAKIQLNQDGVLSRSFNMLEEAS